MKPIVVATLDREDFERFTAVELRYRAMEMNPTAYSAAETESILMAYRRTTKDIMERYLIAMDEEWLIDTYSGNVTYKDG